MKKREGVATGNAPVRGYTPRRMRTWLKVAAVALAGVAAAQMLWHRGGESAREGREAPALELPDLRGQTLDLARLRGRVVALNFWATWCGPCNDELPALARAWREGQGRCQEIVGVTEESPRDEVAAAVKRFDIPYPVVLDADGVVARDYGVTGYPRTYIVDAEGRIRKVVTGRLSQARLEAEMAPYVPDRCTGS